MIYDLLKNIYNLDREDKELLYEMDLKDISAALDQMDMIKIAAGSHDPEKKEDLERLIDSLEKFINVDGDLSVDSVSVFIHPLANSAKRLTFRPLRLIGLSNKLYNLSREYKREKEEGLPEVIETIKNDFKECIQEIRRRIKKIEEKSGNLDGQKKETVVASVIENLGNMVRTSNLSVEQAVDLIDTDNFEFDGKEELVKSLKTNL